MTIRPLPTMTVGALIRELEKRDHGAPVVVSCFREMDGIAAIEEFPIPEFFGDEVAVVLATSLGRRA